ncbi:type ISP restriction/modification enzyme [Enterovirga sp. GCM10030262]|uniref:type ISP restriction/modification enzyme n=1 Tax=Enterovirga sp. GCM10030262 TaxID=3273391 RepID=UPI003613CD71
MLFHPQLRKGKVAARHVRKIVEQHLGRFQTRPISIIDDKGPLVDPVRYGFRSFDRQWLPPDNRLLNDPRPDLWPTLSEKQVFITALSETSPKKGPAITLTSAIPDQDHFSGRGGRVFALWKDAAAIETNVSAKTIAALTRAYGSAPDPVDIFAYVAALVAHPAYTETFKADLIRPGLRVPLTADKTLFAEAAALGREVIWLMSFGERMNEGRPPGEPRLPQDRRPIYPKEGKIPDTPEGFPDSLDYDPVLKRLKVGTGYIDNVPQAVWDYEVSGKNVLRQWFSYRRKNRERPQIGDRRPPSPLGDIQPDRWLPEYTSELINVLNVLAMLVELEPRQADLLKRIVEGPLIPAVKVSS